MPPLKSYYYKWIYEYVWKSTVCSHVVSLVTCFLKIGGAPSTLVPNYVLFTLNGTPLPTNNVSKHSDRFRTATSFVFVDCWRLVVQFEFRAIAFYDRWKFVYLQLVVNYYGPLETSYIDKLSVRKHRNWCRLF